VGAFFYKFSIAPCGETSDQIKKLGGAKMVRTSSITVQSMLEIVGRAPAAVDEKLWCFICVRLSRFGMTKFVITATLRSSVIFKTIMALLHRGRFVVVVCSCIFNFLCAPPKFSLRGKFIPKISIFWAIFEAVVPHFKARTVKFGMRVRTWDSLPNPNFTKIAQGGIPLLGKLIPKILISAIWGL